MWLQAVAAFLPVAVAAVLQVPGRAPGNQCAECHLQRASLQSRLLHVDEWVTSKHALYRIGCEKCHGGDAAARDERTAHAGVLNSADPTSPVHWMALPATCGRCHVAESNAFARSGHQELLRQGDAMVPTCTSCHSSMAGDVPEPAALESRCLHCHPDDPQNRARLARHELEDVARLRSALKRAKVEIAAIIDSDRRATLTAQWSAAGTSVAAAVVGVHGFDTRRVEDRLSEAHAQVDRLLASLGRKSPRLPGHGA